ncbi:hypothetical protein ACFYTS_13285 [Nocardia sp. NPDC004151]|uniref:hypothetical protein n=1 Tax=Nocardia sp. NPDC004151 TaxID=3364304 RepID=UPI0036CB6AA9
MLGLRISEACRCDIDDLGEEHGHRVQRTIGKGTKIALVPLPPAVGRPSTVPLRTGFAGPILLNSRGRHGPSCATRHLRRLAERSVVRLAISLLMNRAARR